MNRGRVVLDVLFIIKLGVVGSLIVGIVGMVVNIAAFLLAYAVFISVMSEAFTYSVVREVMPLCGVIQLSLFNVKPER